MGFWSNIFGKGGAYFLDDESAKGLGDTEYMKQSKTVRRTFPGAAGEEEFEVVRQVSAMDKTTFDNRESGGSRPTTSYQPATSFSSQSAPQAASSAPEETLPDAPAFQPRRDTKVNTDMDIFRNMAKKVGR
jgi:hypothetical protein